MGRFGQTQGFQGVGVRHRFQVQVFGGGGQGSGIPRHGQGPAFGSGGAQAEVVTQPFGLPAQKMVQLAGGGADVVAGQHRRAQQIGQSIHQFQTHAVVALGGHPDGNPHPGGQVPPGGDISGNAEKMPFGLFCHRKVGGTTLRPGKVEVVELRPVDQGQVHIKMCVDEIQDGGIFPGMSQPKMHIRQERNLPSQAGSRR